MKKYLYVSLILALVLFMSSCGLMGPGAQPANPPNNMPHDPNMDGNIPNADLQPNEPDEPSPDVKPEDKHGASNEHEEVAPPPTDLAFDEEKARNTFVQNCARCHGVNLEGGGAFPSLQNVGQTHTKDDILNVIKSGQGVMPANLVTGEEAENLAKWLWTKR